ncbi:helix-turn-helix transcriptional regulator [Bacillus sp. AFS073361]|uniref:helix-turn-helix transcriptional regulator n=1 Tax=Bacillus sp. AFS073361 TaxID=2033511 RepID=UPI0015D4E82C|nr:helix-turn-helix transcriptional regulator [Bacillus sp. AFS073361]
MKRHWMVSHRKEEGLTQDELAKLLGISRSYYTQIENGTHNPSGALALKMSNFFDVEMSKFFYVECCDTQTLKEVK